MTEINGIRVPFIPITDSTGEAKPKLKDFPDSFDSVFNHELEKIKFSNHAMKRLETRNIELSDEALNKLNTAVEKAEQKGAKDSLVMLDNTAYIINIPNKTVVTALPVGESEENIFTNIDSVVFT